jgi:hypothetical protein
MVIGPTKLVEDPLTTSLVDPPPVAVTVDVPDAGATVFVIPLPGAPGVAAPDVECTAPVTVVVVSGSNDGYGAGVAEAGVRRRRGGTAGGEKPGCRRCGGGDRDDGSTHSPVGRDSFLCSPHDANK